MSTVKAEEITKLNGMPQVPARAWLYQDSKSTSGTVIKNSGNISSTIDRGLNSWGVIETHFIYSMPNIDYTTTIRIGSTSAGWVRTATVYSQAAKGVARTKSVSRFQIVSGDARHSGNGWYQAIGCVMVKVV